MYYSHVMKRIGESQARQTIFRAAVAAVAIACYGRSPALGETSGVVRVVTVDPYRAVDWGSVRHLRANLHTHTAVSDGALAPHRAVDEYYARGYGALALTDHNAVTYPWTAFSAINASYENRDPADLGMVAIAGNELSRHHHVQSLFSTFTSSGTDLDGVLEAQAGSDNGARALLNHPAWHWTRDEPATGFRIPLAEALRQVTQGDLTVETWFRCSDTNRNILMGNYSTSYKGALNLELHTDNRLRFYLQSEGGGVIDRNLSGGAVNTRDGQWHHAAGVRAGGKVRVYLDGRQLGAEANDTLGAYALRGDAYWLGRDARDGVTELIGDLDQARLWARGLSSNEVARLASGEMPGDDGVPPDGLLADYRFDRPAQADDTAGHAAGPFHAARAEPGYRVSLTPALRQLVQGEFALDGWFRTTDTGRNILLGSFTNSALGAVNLELYTGNRVRLYLQPPSGLGRATVDLFGVPTADTRDGRWRHLAGVRSNGVVSLYVDGQEVSHTNDTAGAFDLQASDFFLGRDARLGTTVFKGDLDALRLWGRALTPQEVAQLAAGDRSTEAGVSPEGLLARYTLEASTLARDTAGHAGGPFDAACAAFSSELRVYDVPGPLAAAGRSSSAIRLGWTPAYPASVPASVTDFYAGLFERHPQLVGMEVLNGTMTEKEYPLDRELWDALLSRLMPRRPVWGLANDDMHSLTHLGRDCSVFLAKDLGEASVRDALDAGAYTFSSTRVKTVEGGDSEPPRVERIDHDVLAGRITLVATSGGAALPESAYTWVAMGRPVHTGSSFDYRTGGVTGSYVRAELAGSGGTTYINPFGLTDVERAADADADALPDWWELAFFGDATGAVATAVSPAGMTLAQHYVAGSDPRDPNARFRIIRCEALQLPGRRLRLRWPSAAGRLYTVQRATELTAGFVLLEGAEALEATPPVNEYEVDISGSQSYYRISVRLAE